MRARSRFVIGSQQIPSSAHADRGVWDRAWLGTCPWTPSFAAGTTSSLRGGSSKPGKGPAYRDRSVPGTAWSSSRSSWSMSPCDNSSYPDCLRPTMAPPEAINLLKFVLNAARRSLRETCSDIVKPLWVSFMGFKMLKKLLHKAEHGLH